MRISIFWFLAFIQLAQLPIAFYLIGKEKPLKYWNKYYDKWLVKQALENESDPAAIQNAIHEAELRNEKKLSGILIFASLCFLVMVLIALQAFVYFRFLFIDVFAPATLMMAVGVLFLYRVRAIAPKPMPNFERLHARGPCRLKAQDYEKVA